MPRKRAVEQYEHKGKTRINNPPVGLVDAAAEPAQMKKTYAYDPHLDPSLQWAGKAERTSFEVPMFSLHAHEWIESGGTDRIAMWMLDMNYDGRSLFPRQVFFPMADDKEGWAKLARNLKAEIDEELIAAYRGTVSLPFTPGDKKRAAVKIIDDRGIESLKLVELG